MLNKTYTDLQVGFGFTFVFWEVEWRQDSHSDSLLQKCAQQGQTPLLTTLTRFQAYETVRRIPSTASSSDGDVTINLLARISRLVQIPQPMLRENPGLSVDAKELDSGADEDVTRKALIRLSLKQQTKGLMIHVGGI